DSLHVSVQPDSIVQKHGGLVTLGCVVEPLGINVTWRLNGKELLQSDDVLGIHIDQRLLTIAALNNHTVGRYQCIAHMSEGVVASVPATVTLANLKDFKYDGQHVIEVDEGNTAVIACDLPESHPKAQVRYSVKQEWLEASRDNYLIMPSGNLQIVNASQDDEGTYKCAAYNPVTQEVKTSVSSERLRVRRSTAEAARIIYPTEAQTIIITKGQSLILECVASGIPTPRVTWTKDGSGVSGYNKTRFLLSNLLIDAISEEDSGTYSCMADNGVRKAAASVILYNVQVFEPPEVSMELAQEIITWGQSAKFTCRVRGNPQPSVMWLRNAVPLFSSHRMQLSRRALRLSSVGPEDEGIYQCMAENEVGSAQAMIQLRVSQPEISQISQQEPVGDSAQSVTSTTRFTNSEKMPKGKAVLLKSKPTESATSAQCTSKEEVSPAEAPVILSSPRTTKTDGYELLWRPRHDNKTPILYYIVKYRKVMNFSDNWIIRDVPASQYHLSLTKLDPGSLYEVEMAAYNCAGQGQTAMVTFRTGRRPKPDIVASKEQQLPKDDPGIGARSSNQSDNNRLSPPEAPDRPTISVASETSAYVTWIPRGNGGFPIQAFRVEYKKLKKLGDWMLARSTSYKFRVRALNILGESEPSAASKPYVVSGYSNRAYERPVAGPYITFTDAINETTIMLKWMYIPASNNNTPIHGFYIYYRPTDSDNDSDRYWHSISHLQPETSYDIKMQCFNEGGESEFSNVMMCETKARKSAGMPGRLPPSTVSTIQHPPLNSGHTVLGAGAMVARSSDLSYLIVGVVLCSIVLIIVVFIPFCLWRAWSKQKQAIDLGFPGAGLLVPSCQYTMVPLRGVSTPQINGLHYANGGNGHFPSATVGYSYPKSYDCNSDEAQQQNETNAFLQGRALQNENNLSEPQRLTSPGLEHSSFLCGLPDDSMNQLLQQHDNCQEQYHHHEQLLSLCHSTPQRKMENSTMEDMRNSVFHTDSTCCLSLVSVEHTGGTDLCQKRRHVWPTNPEDVSSGESSEKYLNSLPLHNSSDTCSSIR
ncbi:putative Brother of CDO protein, partial [Naja naja]